MSDILEKKCIYDLNDVKNVIIYIYSYMYISIKLDF